VAFDVAIVAITRITGDEGVGVVVKLIFAVDFDITVVEAAVRIA
jgi:hypothetical protein